MKTKPEEDQPDCGWCVNFVTKDTVQGERVKFRFKQRQDIQLRLSAQPISGEQIDVTVLPVVALDSLGELKPGRSLPGQWLPMIAYGDSALLKHAFVTGVYDYMKEPWTVEELIERVDRLLDLWRERLVFRWGNIRLEGNFLWHAGRKAQLSYQECEILRVLLRQRGKAVPRDVLFYTIWGRLPQNRSRVIDVHVASINRKFGALIPATEKDRIVRSVRGTGYVVYQ